VYVTETSDNPNQTPVERLHDHLHDVDERSDAMQERLDELGEGIDSARKQAEADDLLPTEDDDERTGSPLDEMEWPEGDEDVETPVNDSEFPPGG
jgi:hypothetical protein